MSDYFDGRAFDLKTLSEQRCGDYGGQTTNRTELCDGRVRELVDGTASKLGELSRPITRIKFQ